MLNSSPTPFISAVDGFLAAIFPTECPLCKGDLGWSSALGVCRDCERTVQPWRGAACETCGLPFAAADTPGARCAHCLRGEYAFDIARSYGIYKFPLRNLILRLKFTGHERTGRALGGLLAPLASSLNFAHPLTVPVPLHPSRERERGYNQSCLLAQGLCVKLKKTAVDSDILIRTKRAPAQAGLRRAARIENVRDAFAVRRLDRVRDRDILLVDDVMTTGATASACAAALKRAGAARIAALTVARATPQFPDTPSLPWPGGLDVDDSGPA